MYSPQPLFPFTNPQPSPDIVKSTGKQATNTLNSTTKGASGALQSTTGNVQKTAGKVANAPLKGVNPPKAEHGINRLPQGIRV